MEMGFEDIYVMTREQILDTLDECAPAILHDSFGTKLRCLLFLLKSFTCLIAHPHIFLHKSPS
jgi:hypothetical protein